MDATTASNFAQRILDLKPGESTSEGTLTAKSQRGGRVVLDDSSMHKPPPGLARLISAIQPALDADLEQVLDLDNLKPEDAETQVMPIHLPPANEPVPELTGMVSGGRTILGSSKELKSNGVEALIAQIHAAA